MKNYPYPNLKYELLDGNTHKPERATKRSSGIDIRTPKSVTIMPHSDILIACKVRFDIPEGYDLKANNKSGVSTKKKLIKGAELVDGDYRGELFVHLINFGTEITCFNAGDKIIQLVMREVCLSELEEVESIDTDTERGESGFGSTGR